MALLNNPFIQVLLIYNPLIIFWFYEVYKKEFLVALIQSILFFAAFHLFIGKNKLTGKLSIPKSLLIGGGYGAFVGVVILLMNQLIYIGKFHQLETLGAFIVPVYIGLSFMSPSWVVGMIMFLLLYRK